MGRLFFFTFLIVLAILFFPIYLETDAHYDLNRKKLGFCVYFYKVIPIIGGYISTYKGGVAFHVSKKKAILLPYGQIERERKRFSVFKTFRLKTFNLTTESGAEYLFITAIAHALLRTIFFMKGGKKERIENNLWLTDGDVLRVSLNVLYYFNMYILLKNFIKFCKEKYRCYVRKKL